MDAPPLSPAGKAEHLECLCTAFVMAINARDLNPESTAWTCMPAVFRIGIDHTSQHLFPAFRDATQFLSLEEFLKSWERLLDLMPTYRIRVLDMFTTIEENHATVYIIQEVHGDPEGVVTQNVGVCVFTYRVAEQRWVCTKYRGFRGMGGPVVGAGVVANDFFPAVVNNATE